VIKTERGVRDSERVSDREKDRDKERDREGGRERERRQGLITIWSLASRAGGCQRAWRLDFVFFCSRFLRAVPSRARASALYCRSESPRHIRRGRAKACHRAAWGPDYGVYLMNSHTLTLTPTHTCTPAGARATRSAPQQRVATTIL